MKIKYPIEAFALAMILFSKSMKEALVTGIIIIFLTTLGYVVKKFLGDSKPAWARYLTILIAVLSVGYGIFQIVFINIIPMEMNTKVTLLQLMICLLIVKHLYVKDEDATVNELLYESAIAFACFIGIGILREFGATGSIFGFHIVDLTFMTSNFQGIILGFLFAGSALALTNGIIKKRVEKLNSLWVIIPALLAYGPLSLKNVNEIITLIIGAIIAILLILSIRYKIVYSSLGNAFKKLPIELISIGIVYMILSAF